MSNLPQNIHTIDSIQHAEKERKNTVFTKKKEKKSIHFKDFKKLFRYFQPKCGKIRLKNHFKPRRYFIWKMIPNCEKHCYIFLLIPQVKRTDSSILFSTTILQKGLFSYLYGICAQTFNLILKVFLVHHWQ